MHPHQRPSFWKTMLRHLCLKESWAIFFILGIIMMNYPFMVIFNKDISILGFPLLFLYFYLGWLVSILVIYFFTKAIKLCELDKKTRGEHH